MFVDRTLAPRCGAAASCGEPADVDARERAGPTVKTGTPRLRSCPPMTLTFSRRPSRRVAVHPGYPGGPPQVLAAAAYWGELTLMLEDGVPTGAVRLPFALGSGKFMIPWARMHFVIWSLCSRCCWISAGVCTTPAARACAGHLFVAATIRGDNFLYPSLLSSPSEYAGSGKPGRPCSRTQTAKAVIVCSCCGVSVEEPLLPAAVPATVVEDDDPRFATPGEVEPPQAAARRPTPRKTATSRPRRC